ncbi:hypothetical protein M9194_00675 [Vibrio sp. S4M6]|uniref:hypothetical protein n=1 Tax=Vibrio sinus TaxID=2946865 RepID=UPI00202A1342|nr:hypothetical protein [Vibrio sinus]MCL9779945.1 hypothetical protein [Vibrio sinus]
MIPAKATIINVHGKANEFSPMKFPAMNTVTAPINKLRNDSSPADKALLGASVSAIIDPFGKMKAIPINKTKAGAKIE